MPMTTAAAIAMIEAAAGPGDLFGPDAGRSYRRLARLTHPDTRPGDHRAAAAFAKLADLWRQRYLGDRGTLAARGDLANLYRTGRGLLKVARDPADNDLLDAEAAALTRIGGSVDVRFGAYFPVLAQVQRLVDPRSGAERRANLIGELDGFISLAQVGTPFGGAAFGGGASGGGASGGGASGGGVDPRDAAWMWRRLLVALGAAHRAGVVHGAVLPEHVLIHPADHGLVLVDWCYSGRPPYRLPAIVARHRDRYPPEVLAGQPAGPDADIWLATYCMTGLTGDRLPAPLAAFARGCLLASPRRRPQDAWALLHELDELLGRLYGARKFRPFAIPA
jgi:hypothetical protein